MKRKRVEFHREAAPIPARQLLADLRTRDPAPPRGELRGSGAHLLIFSVVLWIVTLTLLIKVGPYAAAPLMLIQLLLVTCTGLISILLGSKGHKAALHWPAGEGWAVLLRCQRTTPAARQARTGPSPGYVERRKSGWSNIYSVDSALPLRHHTKQDILVSDLLDALTVPTHWMR